MKDDTTDFGFTKVKRDQKHKLVGQVFDSVATNYDLMNDLMSFGMHRLWKRYAIAACHLRAEQHVLDLAAGSGDLARQMSPVVGSKGLVTLCDINSNMLAQAQSRLVDHGIVDNIRIVQGNAENLPFEHNTFDRIIMGFGLRNVTDKAQALKEIYRVLKPSGRAIILEFSHPTSPPLSKLYDLFSFNVLPLLGKWVAKDSQSYQYLAESIRMHPNQTAMQALILAAGFDKCEFQNLTGGIVAVHTGLKY